MNNEFVYILYRLKVIGTSIGAPIFNSVTNVVTNIQFLPTSLQLNSTLLQPH